MLTSVSSRSHVSPFVILVIDLTQPRFEDPYLCPPNKENNDTTVGTIFKMMINSSAGLLTVCGRHVALWRKPLPRFLSSSIDSRTGRPSNTSTKQQQLGRSTPPPILKPGFQPTGLNKDGVYLGSTFLMLSPHTLPELDVAPLLDKTVFTRKAGRTIHGTDAAMRLSKAKNELREVIHQELEEPYDGNDREKHYASHGSKHNNSGGVKKMYIMRRHGVPNQMLQHLVKVADQWLEEKNALELWVDSSCQSSLSVLTTDGSSWRTLWPSEWDRDLALYLASMKRMVSHLGSMTPFCDGSSVLPGDLEWKVSISRHNKLPLTLFPNNPEVFPVIEWVTPTATATNSNAASNGSNKNYTEKVGKIMIRMQGAPNPVIPRVGQDFLKQSHDVSLIFECEFKVAANDVETRQG
jgi:hypothetical protein